MCLSVAQTGAGRASGHLLHFPITGLKVMLFKLKDREGRKAEGRVTEGYILRKKT